MEKVYKVNEFRCYTPGLANLNPQQGHIVRKDSPEGHTGVCVCVCARARMHVMNYIHTRTHTHGIVKTLQGSINTARLLARRYTVRFPAGPEYFSSLTHPEHTNLAFNVSPRKPRCG
jgi:hypothetical protein